MWFTARQVTGLIRLLFSARNYILCCVWAGEAVTDPLRAKGCLLVSRASASARRQEELVANPNIALCLCPLLSLLLLSLHSTLPAHLSAVPVVILVICVRALRDTKCAFVLFLFATITVIFFSSFEPSFASATRVPCVPIPRVILSPFRRLRSDVPSSFRCQDSLQAVCLY